MQAMMNPANVLVSRKTCNNNNQEFQLGLSYPHRFIPMNISWPRVIFEGC